MIRWFKEISSSMCSTSTGRVNCQVCGRSRRIPPELMPNAQYFVCRDCVARAFPDLDNNNRRQRRQRQDNNNNNHRRGLESTLYDPTEAERLDEHPETIDDDVRQQDRLNAMERAKSQTFEIKRVTSTFFKVNNTNQNVETTPTPHGSLELSDLALDDDDDGTCKICMENPATIILLPCGHGGLCQGCAKDLVLAGKTCYICREEFTMLAEMSQKWPSEREKEAKKEKNVKGEYLGRMIRPDALHHAASTARAEDILSVQVTSGEDLDTVTSLRGNSDDITTSDTPPPAAAPASSRPARSMPSDNDGVSTGTLTTAAAAGSRVPAIIAL